MTGSIDNKNIETEAGSFLIDRSGPRREGCNTEYGIADAMAKHKWRKNVEFAFHTGQIYFMQTIFRNDRAITLAKKA